MTPLKIRKIRLQRPPFQTAHDSSILPRHAPPKLLPKYSEQRPLRSDDFNFVRQQYIHSTHLRKFNSAGNRVKSPPDNDTEKNKTMPPHSADHLGHQFNQDTSLQASAQFYLPSVSSCVTTPSSLVVCSCIVTVSH